MADENVEVVELADAIVKLVRDFGSVTHGTMIQHLGDKVRGDCLFELVDKKIVLFVGASALLCDALELLADEKPQRAVLRSIEMLCMIVDSAPMPRGMPLAKRPPKHGYKQRHFAPCCLDDPNSKTVRDLKKAGKSV